MGRHVAVIAVGVLVLGLTVLERLEVGISAMHRPGDVSGRVGDLASPASLWSPQPAQGVIEAWLGWEADRLAEDLAGKVLGPLWTITWYAIADTLLVTLPLTVLLVVLARAGRRRGEASLARVARGGQVAERDEIRARALHQITGLAVVAAVVYGVADTLENLLVAVVVRVADADLLVRLVGLAATMKIVAIAATLLPVLVAVATPAGRAATGTLLPWLRTTRRQLVLLRAPAVAALAITTLFLALRGDIGLQLDDVVMRWIEQPLAGVAAIVAAIITGGLMVLAGQACLMAHREAPEPSGKPLSSVGLALLALLGIALAAGGLILAGRGDDTRYTFGYAMVFPGAVLALFAVLSWPKAVRAVSPPDQAGSSAAEVGPGWLLWTLASVPIFALALVVVRAAVTLAITLEPRVWLLVGAVVLLVWVGVALVKKRPALVPRGRPATRVLWIGVVGLVVLASGYAAWLPRSAGGYLGAVALLFLSGSALVLLLTALTLAGDHWAPRGALALVGLRRLPLITLLVLGFVATSLLDRTGHYHDVRLGAPLPADYRPVMLQEALGTWLSRQEGVETVGGKQRVPMLFIATAGGGIRSAYWTGLVLGCLFREHEEGTPAAAEDRLCDDNPLRRSVVFAASGVSGGSLGLVADRALARNLETTAIAALSEDFLSPDVAALAFRDLPLSLFGLSPRGWDRASVLESAWESAVPGLDQGVFATSRNPDGSARLPLLLLNSATVDDGCRLNASPLLAATSVPEGPRLPAGGEGCLSLTPFEPGRDRPNQPGETEALAGTTDLYHWTCQVEPPPEDPAAPDAVPPTRYDMPISAAAHLSARFPYISPMGALTSCEHPQRRTFALDGGLLEASAVSPLTELWARMSGMVHVYNDDPASGVCIEPRLLLIDNGYSPSAIVEDASRPEELIAPAAGVARFNATWGARAQQAAALAFDHALGSIACHGSDGTLLTPLPVASRIAHVVPIARPGPRAPLGWSLSQFARHDLVDQLNSPSNLCQIALVRSWFVPEAVPRAGRCISGFAVRAAATAPPGTADSVAMLAPPIGSDRIGQAGVVVEVCPRSAAVNGENRVTTDAAGHFVVLVQAGEPATLRVTWAGATITVAVPAGTQLVDTGVNFELDGADWTRRTVPPAQPCPTGIP